MANDIVLNSRERTEFGKGASRRLRQAGLVPAVIYGHQHEPVHVALPAHESQLALRTANALLTIEVDNGQSYLTLPKQVQRHAIKDQITHVDLVIVRRDEKVTVEVPLVIVGEIKGEAMIVSDQSTIEVEAPATEIPSQIEIDISGLQIGDQIFAKDLKLPEDVVFNGDPDDLMLGIQAPQAQDLGGEEEAEATGEESEAAEE
jgi:large subunit ribosomal protein L25